MIMLFELSQFFLCCSPPPSTPHSLRESHTLFMSMVLHINTLATPFPVLNFTSPCPLCNHLFALVNPLTSSPTPTHPLSSFSLLYSIVYRYVIYYHFCSVSILLFLNKPFSISYNNGLVMMNSFSFFLSGKLFICPSILNDNFAG